MVVEDSPIVKEGIKVILGNIKHVKIIGEVSNYRELCNFLKNQKPDIILMDIKLPVLNGIEITKKIKREYPYIKVIIFTVSKTLNSLKLAINAGANGYLIKSFIYSELIKAIDLVYQGKFFITKSFSGIN